MAKRKKGGRRPSSFLQQVIDESRLRFGPEQDALVELVRQATSTARNRRQSVQAGTRGLIAGVEDRSRLGQNAAAAQQQLSAQIGSRARTNTAPLSSAADPFKAIIESELAGSDARGADNATRLQNELGAQRTSAARYQASQLGQVGADLNENLTSIGERLRSLRGQMGTFQAARLGELEQGQRDRKFELRKIRLQQQGDLDKALKLADVDQSNALELEDKKAADTRANTRLNNRLGGGKGGKGGGKPTRGLGSLTQGQENAEVDKVSNAARYADQLLRSGKSREQVLAILTNGASGRKKPAAGQKVGDRFEIPDYGEDRALVALDIAKYGYVRRGNIRRLHARGVHVPTKWRPPRGADAKNTPYHRPGTLG